MGIDSIGKTAFDAIYELYVDSVYNTALRYTRNEHTAEEITQDVFLKLYTYLDHVNMDAVEKWLIVTARNMALNYARKGKREVLFDEIYEDAFTDHAAESAEAEFFRRTKQYEHKEFADGILEHLYRNNERWYEAVTITYCLNKPQKEVAEIMDIPLETLHSILHRARKWIQKNYEQQYDYLNKA